MNFQASNFADAWFDLLSHLQQHGNECSPRAQKTYETLAIRVHVTDMRRNILVHPVRALSYRFMVAEWLWIAAGRNDVASISQYNKHIAEFSDDGQTFQGAYGPRLKPQMEYLIESLKKPDSRQAVASIWTPSPAPSKDIPCTLIWQLLARDGRLHAIVTMRSSDIWLGLPYDFFNFTMLSTGIAGELGLEPGSMTFNLGSSHLYQRNEDKALEVLATHADLDYLTSPRLPAQPWADDILEFRVPLDSPWVEYQRVLEAESNKQAFEILQELDPS